MLTIDRVAPDDEAEYSIKVDDLTSKCMVIVEGEAYVIHACLFSLCEVLFLKWELWIEIEMPYFLMFLIEGQG